LEVLNIRYDVAVVGAGPAGSTAAKFLSEKGHKVLLLDKEKFPRDKPCAGGLTLRVLNRFSYLKEENFIESYSYCGIAYSTSLKYKVKVERNEPIGAMILRKKFDHELVKLAINSGTIFIDGKRVENIKILKDQAKIILNDGTNFESQIVIGADGIWSTIAKKTGLSQKGKYVGMCIFQEYPMSSEVLDKYIGEKRSCHIHLKFQNVVGYGWVFPKKKHVNIGICELKPIGNQSQGKTNLKDVYKNYFNLLKKSKIIPNDLEIGRLRGGALPLYPLEKTYSNRVLLCGDAGGFINPISGEGIYFAMSSGEIAAGLIGEALEAGEISELFLSRYQKIWQNDFGKEIELLLRLTKNRLKDNEKFLKIVGSDKKLEDMALGLLQGRLNLHEVKWKLIIRFLYVYFRELFSKN
jgi:geranylgeranyl reductase family protein